LLPANSARFVADHGMNSPAEITPASHVDDRQLQAIGEARVLVTPTVLLNAYADLVARAPASILDGLKAQMRLVLSLRSSQPASPTPAERPRPQLRRPPRRTR
jgi:hypothetical protein